MTGRKLKQPNWFTFTCMQHISQRESKTWCKNFRKLRKNTTAQLKRTSALDAFLITQKFHTKESERPANSLHKLFLLWRTKQTKLTSICHTSSGSPPRRTVCTFSMLKGIKYARIEWNNNAASSSANFTAKLALWNVCEFGAMTETFKARIAWKKPFHSLFLSVFLLFRAFYIVLP